MRKEGLSELRSRLACAPVGGIVRYLAIGGATLCLAAVTASAGFASRQSQAHAARGAATYSTPGTAPLVTGLVDPVLFTNTHGAAAFALSRSAGATYVRIGVWWRGIAPSSRPTGFDPRDPTSPGYAWTGLDVTLEAAAAAHVTPILDVSGIPRWAFAKRPKSGSVGTPKAAALGDFAHALATHYDGTNGLPAEHVFQVWNEPNLSLDLGPVSASAYRGMVNAVRQCRARGRQFESRRRGRAGPVRPPEGQEAEVVLRLRRSPTCARCSASRRAHIRIRPATTPSTSTSWSHHPYTFGGPFGHASQPDDVELGDLPKMRAVLQAGVRLHHVVSAHPVKFWVTEFGWDSSPPRPHAAPMGLAARWTAESLVPDVALGRVPRHLVPPAGSAEPQPVPEWSLLPLLVAREGAAEAASHGLPLPVRRVPRQGRPSASGVATRRAARLRVTDPASARQERKLADRRVHRLEQLRDLPREGASRTRRRRTGCAR